MGREISLLNLPLYYKKFVNQFVTLYYFILKLLRKVELLEPEKKIIFLENYIVEVCQVEYIVCHGKLNMMDMVREFQKNVLFVIKRHIINMTSKTQRNYYF